MRIRPAWTTFGLIVGAACSDGGTAPHDDDTDSRIRWVHDEAVGIYYGSPALSPDEGAVYVGTSRGLLAPVGASHALVALRVADGAVRWRFPTGAAEVRSAPAVGLDGAITFVVEERTALDVLLRREVIRLAPTGEEVWRRALGISGTRVGIGYAAPAVASDGSVFVAADSLYALNSDGTVRWTRLHTGEEFRTSPAIAADGTVYFVSHNVPLTAFDPHTGDVRWQTPLGFNDHAVAPLSIGGDGAIYVAQLSCTLYAVEPTGAIRWTYDATSLGAPCSIRSSPAIDAAGTIIFGTTEREPQPVLVGVNSDGSLRWVMTPSNLPNNVPASNFDIYSSPAIGSDGTVYVGHEFGRVYAVNAHTGVEQWYESAGERGGITWSSPALTASGLLLINTLQGAVVAIQTPSAGLQAGAPWPRFRGSNQSGGRR